MMGSMGTAVGEKIARLFEYAAAHKLPVVGLYRFGRGAHAGRYPFTDADGENQRCSKTAQATWAFFYLTVLTDPTTGGVTASFAMEGDIILAEPFATVGFAGTRVIEQTTKKKLPQGFQKAEFLLEHGFADAIVPRQNQKRAISMLLELHAGGESK